MRRELRSALHRVLITSVAASACSSLQPVTQPVPAPLQSGQQREIRLIQRNGVTIALFDARLKGDSIIGFDRPEKGDNAVRIAVLTKDVGAIAVRKGDQAGTGLTVLAVVVGTMAVLTLLAILSCAADVAPS